MSDYLPESELEDRRVYEIQSRNLTHGVWVAKKHGFIGIRLKFDRRFLFMEYHYDHDPHVGTVRPVRPLDAVVPEDIPLVEYLGSYCDVCDSNVEFVPDTPGTRAPGRQRHIDRSLDEDHDPHGHTFMRSNQALFDFLEAL